MVRKTSECPKQMLNGPCGGVRDGDCEIGGKCTWVTAFNKMKQAGKLDDFLKIKVPKR